MTLDVCADLDDVTVNLDAAICAATDTGRQDVTSEFAGQGISEPHDGRRGRLCGFSCGLTAGWPDDQPRAS